MRVILRFIPIALPCIALAIVALTKTKTIECQLNGEVCPAEVQQSLQNLIGKSFFFQTTPQVVVQALPPGLGYSITSMHKKLPATILLDLQLEKPLYVLTTQQESQAVVAESGVVLTQQTGTGLPVITTQKESGVSEFLDQHHAAAAILAVLLQEKQLTGAQITWKDENNILLKIEQKPIIIISAEVLLERPKIVLTLIDSPQIEAFEEPIVEIDARMNLPVLRTQPEI